MRTTAGMLLLVGIAAAMPLRAAPAAPRASFDCSRAASRSEKTVCADPALRTLDARLAAAFANALHDARDRHRQIAAQSEWLRDTRDVCDDAECMRRAYTLRIDELTGRDRIAGVYDRAFGARKKTNDPGELTLRALGDGAYALHGEALWISGVNPDNVHVGDVAQRVVVKGSHLHVEDGECRLEIELRPDVLRVTRSSPECGGLNVTFDGDYARVAR